MSTLSLNTNGIFLKGFTGSNEHDITSIQSTPDSVNGKLYVVITNMITTKSIAIYSAVPSGENWLITDEYGTSYLLKKEPKSPLEIFNGLLLFRYRKGYDRQYRAKITYYSFIVPNATRDYSEIEEAIQNGSTAYCFSGYLNKTDMITSPITKLWKDNAGRLHGITVDGSHYII